MAWLSRWFARFRKTDGAPPEPETLDGDEDARAKLRDEITSIVRGETRLGRNGKPGILFHCESLIEEHCPPAEQDALLRFAEQQIDIARTRHAEEMGSWPEWTDCDRLDQAEAALREEGILLWQASPCCTNCTLAELPDRVDVLEQRYPGFRGRMQGYAYFLDQNMPERLADDPRISLLLGYGWHPPSHQDPDEATYQAEAKRIGQVVQAQLEDQGLLVDWDGGLSKKIGVTLAWQRRTPLS